MVANVIPVNTTQIQRGRPFKPGQSGNPAGRPKGARNRATIAAEVLLEGEAEALTRKAVELALAGDTTALRLCLERLTPPRKDRPVSFAMPPIECAADAVTVMEAVLWALASGELTPSEAASVAAVVETYRRTAEARGPDLSTHPGIRVTFVGDPRHPGGQARGPG
jgi:hypothetical protein